MGKIYLKRIWVGEQGCLQLQSCDVKEELAFSTVPKVEKGTICVSSTEWLALRMEERPCNLVSLFG